MSNEYDAAVTASLQPDTAQAARVGFSVAADTNPDTYAEAQRVARRTGVPVDTVFAMPAEMKKQDAIGSIDFNALAKTSPATAALLSDVEKAKVAHDDVDNMSKIESVLYSIGKFEVGTGKAIASSAMKFNEGAWGLARAGADLLPDVIGDPLANKFAEYGASQRSIAARLMPKTDNIVESSWYSGMQSLGLNLLQLPLGIGGKMTPLLTSMGLNTGGQAYGEARDKGRGVPESLNFAASQGIVEAGTEMFGMPALLSMLKPGGFGKKAMEYLIKEQGGEQVATHLQDLNEWATLNPEKSFKDYLAARPSAALQTALATAFGGGGQVAIMRGAQLLATRGEEALQANNMGDLLTDLNKLAEASKLRARDTESAQAFFQSVLDEGRDAVYVSPEALAQSGLAEKMAQAIPAVAEQLQTAAEAGHDIRIPIADLMATMAGPELEQSLLPHVATEPGGFTPTTAKEYLQSDQAKELQAEVDRVLGEKEGDDTFKASAQAVKTTVKDQLTTAGRFTESVNDAYSSMVGNFFAVQAARMGTTPEAMFERYPLRIGAESVAGENVLQQGAGKPSGAMDEATGLPLNTDGTVTVYHHTTAENAAEIKRTGLLKSAGEPDLYFTTTAETNTGYGDTAIPFRIVPSRLLLDDEFPDGRQDFRVDAKAKARRVRFLDDGSALLNQQARGSFNPATLQITLLKNADLSTFLHESGHFFLEVQADLAGQLQREAAIHGADTLKPGEQQVLKDVQAMLDWFGVKDLAEWNALDFEEKRSYHEQFARGFEAYLFEGTAPSIEMQGLFQRFRAWLMNVYRDLKELNVELTDEVRSVFDRMLATDEQIALAEQGRSMMPLFTSPEQVGMTPAEFADYQALGTDATNEAVEDLQARGLRDMQWLHNARGRIIKKLQVQSKEQRAAVEMDIRREVMAQPIYRAWTFLTAKQTRDDLTDPEKARADYREALGTWNAARKEAETAARKDAKQEVWAGSEEGSKKYRKDGALAKAQQKVLNREEKAIDALVEKAMGEWEQENRKPADPDYRPKSSPNSVDETQDSLFSAIGKLGGIDKADVVNTWGVDPADKPTSGVFGKPLWRLEGGLSIDGMAEALSQYGYLPTDEHGKWDIRDLEDKFKNELGGSPEYSNAYDYAANQAPDNTIANPMGLTAGRLERSIVPADVADRIKKMTSKDGIHPDIVAEMFGFSSGDELVRKLAAAESPKAEIDALTDQRMLEQFGDLSSQQAIEKAADKAIHNEARARMISTELAMLEKAIGKRTTLASAAKQYAAAMIARLKVRDIKPGQYAAGEVRASKASEKASKSSDLATAAAEKRNQLINAYATRAAYDAQEEVEKGLRYLKTFDSAGKRKGLDADYTDQIDALLERFDLRKGVSGKALDKRAALAEWITAQRDAGLEPDVPPALVNEAFRKSYKDLTVEEMRGLIDTIKQIEHLGRLKHKLLTARDQRAYEAVRDEIVASIEQHSQGREADTRTPTTNMGRAVQGLKRFWASHIKAATWARVMDGGNDGGPMWEYFVRSANERGDQETRMRAEATGALAEIMAPIFAMGKMGGKGQFFPSINRSLNREARITLALNVGNASNLQRLQGGEGWASADIMPVLQSLTAQEWQAVQAVWDHFESYRPLINAKERRVYGRDLEFIDPTPFSITTADGQTVQLRGGYYPVKYDPAASQRAEEHADAEGAKRQLKGAYVSATTRDSFRKGRVEEVNGRPLLYTLAGLYSGVNDVIHDLAWHEWLVDANRLLRSKSIDGAIRNHYGPEAKQQFKTWVQDVAEGEKGADAAVDLALSRLRQGVSAAGLGFNVMSALIQPLGITQSIVRVGPEYVARGLVKYLASPIGSTREANEMSSFMENRARTRFRELNELRNQVQDQSAFKEIIGRYAYFLMMRCQQMVDVPTWHGAYEKAIAEGNDEAMAINLADQAVIDAQGGGQTKDLSAIERGGPAQKLFTVFYSFMNTALNLGTAQTMSADTPAKKAKLAADYALLYVVPSVLGYFLKNAITPGDSGDDDMEKIAKRLAANQIDYLMGLMVVVREFGEAAKTVTGANDMGRDYTGPAGLRMVADSVAFAKQAHQGEFDDAFRKAAVNVVGDLFGLPSAQINRTITGTKALVEGETSNPAAIAFGFQKPR